MESLEISAKTVEEAIQLALERLGVTREEVEITVLKEGKAGLWGLGAEEAKVRVTLLVPVSQEGGDIVQIVKEVLEKLLNMMGVPASVTVDVGPKVEEGVTPIALNIEGDDLGILIGRRGQTLAALQYVVRIIVAHRGNVGALITLDVEGYKQHRSEALENLARRLAGQVKTRKSPFTLEPMPAYERRIIHIALLNHPDVVTYSIGEGEGRKVVIAPKEKQRNIRQ